MAPTEQAPPDPTRRDPSDILAKLEQLIKDRQPKKGQSRSWVMYLIMGLLAIAGVAIFSWTKMRHGRQPQPPPPTTTTSRKRAPMLADVPVLLLAFTACPP